MEVVQALLEAHPGAAKAKDEDGVLPLHHAAKRASVEVVKLLLDKGAALRTSHAVKQRLCSVECGDGRVAAVDEDCRARRQQKPRRVASGMAPSRTTKREPYAELREKQHLTPAALHLKI